MLWVTVGMLWSKQLFAKLHLNLMMLAQLSCQEHFFIVCNRHKAFLVGTALSASAIVGQYYIWPDFQNVRSFLFCDGGPILLLLYISKFRVMIWLSTVQQLACFLNPIWHCTGLISQDWPACLPLAIWRAVLCCWTYVDTCPNRFFGEHLQVGWPFSKQELSSDNVKESVETVKA